MSIPTTMHDDPTILFHNIREEELTAEVISPYTDEEYHAFVMSVTPHATNFNSQESYQNNSNDSILDNLISSTLPNDEEDTSFDPQKFLELMSSQPPDQFVMNSGFDPSTFEALKMLAENTDLWDPELTELLESSLSS